MKRYMFFKSSDDTYIVISTSPNVYTEYKCLLFKKLKRLIMILHVLKSLCLPSRYGISPENIILYGQSIGTVPTVDLASRFECAAVVLHSPLTSGMRVAFPDTKKTYCFDAFPK